MRHTYLECLFHDCVGEHVGACGHQTAYLIVWCDLCDTRTHTHTQVVCKRHLGKSAPFHDAVLTWHHSAAVLAGVSVLQSKCAGICAVCARGRVCACAFTLITSLTPSRVSTASGMHSLNQPVANTLPTSCFTCAQVDKHAQHTPQDATGTPASSANARAPEPAETTGRAAMSAYSCVA